MKKMLLLLLMCSFMAGLHAQEIKSGSYQTMYRISSDGTIKNGSYNTVGYIKNGTIKNKSYATIGYIKDDGSIKNSSYSTIGYVKKDGTVKNSSYSTIGYVSGVPKEWAAVIFFFFQF
ncbi:hypothetical protein HHL16_17120 [Pseudoflavitalea sp. G-6-1-2]|uniref:5-fold beta-flower protein n=1 Tax=Pseudoflavitalea sp. G-6-1-2 TaxID=2728841 RepID=UPI00146E8B6A|nr:hypothetical protein [Pseudoflavitalea sp. G-6-1-2]NML22607.1 hypothetical protein [Pseudoflavitalea sp. G-6-1-2]